MPSDHEEDSSRNCRVLFSTQSGRAKACARRVERILTEQTNLRVLSNTTFDIEIQSLVAFCKTIRESKTMLFLFVSTTGDGEHTDTIQNTWKQLLQRSLPTDIFHNITFALFCLGDRAYGPQFCAAGRKLAVRLMQLGAKTICSLGYGDDGTPNGGVFYDLDVWIRDELLTKIDVVDEKATKPVVFRHTVECCSGSRPGTAEDEPSQAALSDFYDEFFRSRKPLPAYSYDSATKQRVKRSLPHHDSPLVAQVITNDRLTPPDWEQETRHIRFDIKGDDSFEWDRENLPYRAGDVASVFPRNSREDVEKFLQVLPSSIRDQSDSLLTLKEISNTSYVAYCGAGYPFWPKKCTLRGWLMHCADINSLPEREDLRALSQFCSLEHNGGSDQRDKLISLSDTSGAALYADYILREKRKWAEVLYDFDSLRATGSLLSLSALFALLSPMRYRDFSIASSPTNEFVKSATTAVPGGFNVELCVAKVESSTPLGRTYRGLCSAYLASCLLLTSEVRLWIRPGTFGGLPLSCPPHPRSFDSPVLYVGAGTGIAPLRGLILERSSVRNLAGVTTEEPHDNCPDVLVFGCRKKAMDFYYESDWTELGQNKELQLFTAFSRDQWHKVYVQQVLQKQVDVNGFLANHLQVGSIYVAGNPLMARTVKEVLLEALAKEHGGDMNIAGKILACIQREGRFTVEAWN